MVLAKYDLGPRVRIEAWTIAAFFTLVYLGMGILCFFAFPGFWGVIMLVILVGVWLAASRNVLIRAVRLVELTDTELRWTNAIRINSRPLGEVAAIRCAEVFVVKVGRHDRVTVDFVDGKTIVFKPAVSGLEEFMESVRNVAPHVEVSPG